MKQEKYSESTMAIGAVYKKLRCSKGFSQKEAAGSEISTTHLSNFENGNTILSVNHFQIILQNINVNMFEFQYMYNNYLRSKDILLFDTEISEAYEHSNGEKVKYILGKINEALIENPTIKKYKLDKIHVEIILSIVDSSYEVSEEEVKYLLDYLYNLKEWGQYDIFLLGHCAKALDWFDVFQLTNHLIKPTQEISELHYLKLAQIQAVINIISILLEKGVPEYAKDFFNYLERSNISDNYMYEKFTLNYEKYIWSYKNGDESALRTLKNCQEILTFCNCFDTANKVKKEIIELEGKKEYHNY